MAVSILFILPIPGVFRRLVRRAAKRALLDADVAGGRQLSAGRRDDVDPRLVWRDDVWTLLVPAALFFFGAGHALSTGDQWRNGAVPFLAGTAGALVGGMQNMGSGALAWFSAMLPQTSQFSLGC
jgi:DHA1 family 2-module integral membrane pump EmrD-like MFS transporter